MLRNFALIAACAGGLMAAGCRNDGGTFTPADLSHVTDASAGGGDGGGGGGGDMSVQKMYTTMSPHDVDTGGGTLKNMAVKLSGVVVTTPLDVFTANKKTTCKYSVTVQDPACTTPPCGIIIEETGMTVAAGVTTGQCIGAKDMTMLGALKVGDMVDAAGIVDIFPDSMNSMIAQHSLVLDTVMKTGGPVVIAPLMVTDPPTATANSMFIVHTTGSWPMYEGTLITVVPPSGNKLTVVKIDTATPFDFYTSPPAVNGTTVNGASFGTNFRFAYNPNGSKDGGTEFPAMNQQFSSITGVVGTIFGGSILPRFMSDFAP